MRQETNSVHYIDPWLSVDAYARQSGIGNRAVYRRTQRKAIAAAQIGSLLVIDALLSPPSKQLPPKHIAPPFVIPAGVPSFSTLVCVPVFCEQKQIRANTLFTDIILGKMPAWGFADQVFVENDPQLKQYLK